MLVLLVLVGCLVEEISCDPFDCYDACTTGCAVSYMSNRKFYRGGALPDKRGPLLMPLP